MISNNKIFSLALLAVVSAVGCSSGCSWVACCAASSTTAAGSAVLWPATLSGSTLDAALIEIWHFTNVKRYSNKRKNNNNDRRKSQYEIISTYRSERLCVAVKTLLLVLPVAAAASIAPRRVDSV